MSKTNEAREIINLCKSLGLRGIVSSGMVLCAANDDAVELLEPPTDAQVKNDECPLDGRNDECPLDGRNFALFMDADCSTLALRVIGWGESARRRHGGAAA